MLLPHNDELALFAHFYSSPLAIPRLGCFLAFGRLASFLSKACMYKVSFRFFKVLLLGRERNLQRITAEIDGKYHCSYLKQAYIIQVT